MIIFNGKNSYTDFDLYIASREQSPAKRKEVTETVPYMSGIWDFSYHDGDIDEYEPATIKYTFDVIADSKKELKALRNKLVAWVHSKGENKLIDTDISDTDYYLVYHGQASWSEEGLQGLLTAEFTCYSFILTDKTEKVTLSTTSQSVTIENEGNRPVTPTIKVASKNFVQNYVVGSATQYAVCLYVTADLQPNTIYTLSFVGASGHNIYLNENLFIETGFYALTGEKQSITVTTKSDISTAKSAMYNTNGWLIAKNRSGNTVTPAFSNVQIEEGKTSTEYVAFVASPTATISDGANTHSLSAGEHKGVLTLKQGETALTVTGAGLLTVDYSEEVL